MGEMDRQRHQGLGLVAGEAEHQPLVAGALGLLGPLGRLGAVHAQCDVSRLAVQYTQDSAAAVVEADGRVVVADAADGVTDGVLDVEQRVLSRLVMHGHLAGEDHQPGGHQRLAGHAGVRVGGDEGVHHGVGNVVANLVGVALGDGFTGEKSCG